MSVKEGCCTKAIEISNLWYAPEELLRGKMGNIYKNHPVMSRVVAIPLAVIDGMVKPLLFPVMALVGMVAMPLIAFGRYLIGKDDSTAWLQAWTFSLLVVGGTLAFLMISAHYMTLLGSSLTFLGGVTISIAVHVYRAVKAPPPLKLSQELPEITKTN